MNNQGLLEVVKILVLHWWELKVDKQIWNVPNWWGKDVAKDEDEKVKDDESEPSYFVGNKCSE